MARQNGGLTAALLAVALLGPGLASAQGADPDAVASAYEAARTSGDLEALVSVFADDATVTDRLGNKHAGTDEIRRLLHLASSRGRALAISERRVHGDRVFWVEHSATPDLNFASVVEAVVQGGRITSLEYRDRGPQLAGAEQLPPGTLLPPSLGLALPLFELMVAVTILSVRSSPAATTSRGRTALLVGLRQWRLERRQRELSRQAPT